MPTNARPKWWQLYLTFPLLVALFAADSRLKLSARGHQLVQIGAVLRLYGLIHMWVKANTPALSGLDRRDKTLHVHVLRIPVARPPEFGAQSDSQFPSAEIHGLLSNTFEMDYTDSDELSIVELSQDIKDYQ